MSVLSQDEIDALVNQLHDPSAVGSLSSRKVKDFDFRYAKRSEKFNSGQLQTLRMLHDNFTRLLNNSLSVYLRTRVEATITRLDQIAYGDFIAAADDNSILSIFSMDPLPGSAMLKIDTPLIFSIVDRLLGGPGWVPKKLRDLTDIERTLVTKFLGRMFNSYRESWNYLMTLSLKIEALDSNAQFIPRIIPLDQMVAVVSCELKVNEISGSMSICLPYAVLQSIGSQLADFQWSPSIISGHNITDDDIAKLQHNVERADVDIQIELGRTNVSLHELATLQAGNVVVFDSDTSKPLAMYVNGCQKFHVYPGVNRDRLAVLIADVIEDDK